MKNYVLCIAALFLSLHGIAQNAVPANIEINKIAQPCVTAEYSIPADMVEGALKKKFNDMKLGNGEKTKDGFRVYKGVVIPDITKEKMDVYYKVEDKKPMSAVHMLTSKGYDNFMKMDPDSLAVNNTMTFLNGFVKDATAFHLSNLIEKQNDQIKDVEKKQRNAAKDGESLQKSRAKIESSISRSTIELSALKAEMENQQKALELVRTKTATVDQMKALKKEVSKQEDVTKKATKKYDNEVKNNADNKEDLAKTEKEITDNLVEQDKLKSELDAERKKLEDLKAQLSNLK